VKTTPSSPGLHQLMWLYQECSNAEEKTWLLVYAR
jgi:hypothetical protein